MSGMMLAFAGGSYGAAPVNTVAPVVSGTATFGQTLTTTNGTWTGAPAPTFTYQWQRVTTNISGATSSTYVLVAADVGNTIRCVVKATNTIAPSGVTANSNSTASVAATVPDAPTIGTATSTGSTTATVAYTAPANNGGATITSYTATSSPGSITGTLSQAGSGTITVSGLSGGTSYTFTVYATNSAGNSASSSASNSITTTPVIGQAFAGGYFAGQVSYVGNGVADYNLVVSPASSGQNTSKQWKSSGNSDTPGTYSLIDGLANSNSMNNSNFPAAYFCRGLSIGGYTDWYLPANNELTTCYYFLKPTTNGNNTNQGANANAVSPQPINTNFTLGDPAQTSVSNFQSIGADTFVSNGNYTWSSTQDPSNVGKGLRNPFRYGSIGGSGKDYSLAARAIRKVAV